MSGSPRGNPPLSERMRSLLDRMPGRGGAVDAAAPHWRQGDLLIRRVDQLPGGLRRRPDLVLAEGEVTGHAHRLERGVLFEDPATSDHVFFTITIDTTLLHEEHAPIRFAPGNYEVVRQRQFDPFNPELNPRVLD